MSRGLRAGASLTHVRGLPSRESPARQMGGFPGTPLKDRSSAPLHCPTVTEPEVVEKIVHLRQHYHFGPMKITMYLKRYHLRREEAGSSGPASHAHATTKSFSTRTALPSPRRFIANQSKELVSAARWRPALPG